MQNAELRTQWVRAESPEEAELDRLGWWAMSYEIRPPNEFWCLWANTLKAAVNNQPAAAKLLAAELATESDSGDGAICDEDGTVFIRQDVAERVIDRLLSVITQSTSQ